MPGLGGKKYSKENALHTADAMCQINPDYIRIRTLAIPESSELFEDCKNGSFLPMGDLKVSEELLLFLKHLKGITSTVKSDHILNLFQEVEGRLPQDRERMEKPIQTFLDMDAEEQLIYRVGRRTGIFSGMNDLNNPELLKQAENACYMYKVTLSNIDDFTQEMMKRFI